MNNRFTWMLSVAVVLAVLFLSMLQVHAVHNRETMQKAENIFLTVEAINKEQEKMLKEQRILLTQLSLTLEEFRKRPETDCGNTLVKTVALLTDSFNYYLDRQKDAKCVNGDNAEIPRNN